MHRISENISFSNSWRLPRGFIQRRKRKSNSEEILGLEGFGRKNVWIAIAYNGNVSLQGVTFHFLITLLTAKCNYVTRFDPIRTRVTLRWWSTSVRIVSLQHALYSSRSFPSQSATLCKPVDRSFVRNEQFDQSCFPMRFVWWKSLIILLFTFLGHSIISRLTLLLTFTSHVLI